MPKLTTYERVRKGFFPCTSKCGVDGNTCTGDECMFFLKEPKECWQNTFDLIMIHVFGEAGYFHPKQEDGRLSSGLEHVHTDLSYYRNDRDKGWIKTPITAKIEIGFDSFRLAEEVQKKFKLDAWRIEGHNWEGGDDHVLTIDIPGEYKDRGDIEKFYKEVLDLVPKIQEFEKVSNTCMACKKHKDYLTDHKDFSICHSCERKIIEDHVASYIEE